jgi:hypothetical protein
VTGRVEPLPETHENSNHILLRIPIEISNNAHGEIAIAVAEGPYANQIDLSRHLGVSRVWVSRVLKGIKSKAG